MDTPVLIYRVNMTGFIVDVFVSSAISTVCSACTDLATLSLTENKEELYQLIPEQLG